jgi:hypothetical protein
LSVRDRSAWRISPDEFVPVDEFVASSQIYRDIALAMMYA